MKASENRLLFIAKIERERQPNIRKKYLKIVKRVDMILDEMYNNFTKHEQMFAFFARSLIY